jgi:predicted phage terminase large subunit-like protein
MDWEIRTEIDTPLHHERFDNDDLDDMEGEMGPYAAAGQLQQRPAPRGGGMFEVDKFKILREISMAHVERVIRYWDKAGTEGGGKRTAGVKMYKLRGGEYDVEYLVADVIKGQWSATQRERTIRQTAEIEGVDVLIWVEQEGGSGGKESAENTIRNLAGYVCHADKVTASKDVRAEPYASQVGARNVGLLRGAWNAEFLAEHAVFPVGAFSDQVDAASGAFNKITDPPKKKRGGVWGSEYARR